MFSSVTQISRVGAVKLKVFGPRSSLSAGAIVGIATGILAVIALATGLGYFLFSRDARWPLRETAATPIHETTRPPSEKAHPTEATSGWPRPVYDNVPELQGQVRAKEDQAPLWESEVM
ncbi:carcinoembryonic antigen-related cell adhesion molecule 20 isoform X2 [Choloepus didactylus]|uniref:carcinoembryonic antigen-related cell adhesion molecule 20 isoform X2 n=1 Tax=Choloepus didactylus TaxID=27675 RepID=UPI00189EE909|nr:carcinoembryonic antigen-related cell adhesion molecule 20 isoform X2 [Choloepus didactylus]